MLVSVDAGVGEFEYLVVALADGHLDVGVVDECKEVVGFAVSCVAPSLSVLVEVEAHAAVVVEADYVIALAVAFHKVFAVVALDDFVAFGHGVAAAPELDRVEHQQVGKA